MRDDDSCEGRLRELLRDPGWSLSPRPDVQARIRRSARRQRVTLTGLAACTGAAAATAVAVPLALPGGGDQGTRATPAAAGHVTATQPARGHATILMPNVTGMKLKQAETVILSVTTHGHITILRIKATQTTGVVIRQAPSPGARVATDSQITLTVPKAG
jgi:PASTA domain